MSWDVESDMACATSVLESKKILRQLSHQSSDGGESTVQEEVDLLSNVYFDELEIDHTNGGMVLAFHITPSTADDKDRQFVYLYLNVILTNGYPHSVPEIHFGQSRGLSDAHLRGICEGLHHKSQEYLGSPMIYELVEYAKDCLTDNNRPCGQCAVCQFDFEETDEFTKTECYHYFHLPCLVRYVEFFRHNQQESQEDNVRMDQLLRKKPKELECPVCREPIAANAACLEAIRGVFPSSHVDDTDAFRPSASLKSWQTEMVILLRKQREKGGTIDPMQEDNYVIDETWVSTTSRRKDGGTKRDEALSDGRKDGGTKRDEALSDGSRLKIVQRSDGHEISGHSQLLMTVEKRKVPAQCTSDSSKVEPRQREPVRRPPPGFPPRPAGQTSSSACWQGQIGDEAARNNPPPSSRKSHHNPRHGREGEEWRYPVRDDYSKGPPRRRDWHRAKQHEEEVADGAVGELELKKEPTPEQGEKYSELQATEQGRSRDQSSSKSRGPNSDSKPHRRKEYPRERGHYGSRQWRHKQDYPPERPASYHHQRRDNSDRRKPGAQGSSDGGRQRKDGSDSGRQRKDVSDSGRPGSQQRKDVSDSGRPGSQRRKDVSDSGRPGSQQRKDGSDSGRPGSQQRKDGSDSGRPGSQQRKDGSDSGRPGSQQRKEGERSDHGDSREACGGGMDEKHSPILQVQ